MTEPIAATESGAVRGTVVDGVRAFRGIPYAASPVGPLRFAAPAAAPHWDGIRDATRPGPSVPQGPSRLEAVMGPRSPDWDEAGCLNLNVWAPEGAGLPVLLWFHGGGFTSGSGGWDWYDGARLAAHGIVVVTANYRVGPFGYLHLPELGADNLGTRDQSAALDWVARNIARFGGDPERITVGGQSAGAYSALYLALSPTSGPRVRGVLTQSGPFGMALQDPGEGAVRAARFLAHTGVDDLAALRSLPAERLLAAYGALAAEVSVPGSLAPPMYPVLGGFGAELPWEQAVRSGRLRGTALLTGTTRDEMSAFLAFGPAAAHRDPAQERRLTDALFRDGTIAVADHHADFGDPAYVYRFDRTPQPDPATVGATHCAELPFVFDRLDAYDGAAMLGPVSSGDSDLAREFCGAIAGFVATGRPADDAWQPYRAGAPSTVRTVR